MPSRPLKSLLRKLVPQPQRQLVRRFFGSDKTRPSFAKLRRTTPFRRNFGWRHGQCIDRYYIENFLQENQDAIRGNVLEVGDNNYTRKFGGTKVDQSHVFHAQPGNPAATIVGDLTKRRDLPENTFDCMVLTQVLQFIFDVDSAVATIRHALRPGGVALVTLPGISQIARYDMDHWGEFWRFTSVSVGRLFARHFPDQNIEIASHGNVLAAVALLHGFVTSELTREELDHVDPDYEITIVAKVEKPRSTNAEANVRT